MQHFRIKEEKVYTVRRCPTMEVYQYTRKVERTPLGNIQDKATKGNLALDYGKQEKRLIGRSSSTSVAEQGFKYSEPCLSPIDFISGKKLVPGLAESTRILQQKQKTSSTSKITQSRSRTNSCKTALIKPNRTVVKKTAGKTSKEEDDVFAQPKKPTKINSIKIQQKSSCKCSTSISTAPQIIIHSASSSESSSSNIASAKASLYRTTYTEKKSSSGTKPKLKVYVPASRTQTETTSDLACTTLPSQNYVTLSHNTATSTKFFSPSYLTNVNFTRDTSFVPEQERTFVDGSKFFRDGVKEVGTISIVSPHKVAVPVRRSSSLSESFQTKCDRQPAVKSTLKRRSSSRRQIAYPLLHSPDYLEDIVRYTYDNRNNFLLHINWINSYVDKRSRTFTVNWVLELAQITLPEFDPALFMLVRIFDYAVMKLKLTNSSYQLAALVSLWLCVKYVGVNTAIRVPKLHRLGSGKYSKSQILSMELRVLQSVNFCLNISDPLIFLYNYLISAKLEDNEMLKFSAMFIMECTTLFESFPVGDPALIAASALYLAFTVLNNNPQSSLRVNYRWYKVKDVQWHAENVLTPCVRIAIGYNFEPVKKYRTVERLRITDYFLNL